MSLSHSLSGSRYSEQVHKVQRVFISASQGETAFGSGSLTPSDNVQLQSQTWHLTSEQLLLADALLRCRRSVWAHKELDRSNRNKQVYKVVSEWSWLEYWLDFNSRLIRQETWDHPICWTPCSRELRESMQLKETPGKCLQVSVV